MPSEWRLAERSASLPTADEGHVNGLRRRALHILSLLPQGAHGRKVTQPGGICQCNHTAKGVTRSVAANHVFSDALSQRNRRQTEALRRSETETHWREEAFHRSFTLEGRKFDFLQWESGQMTKEIDG